MYVFSENKKANTGGVSYEVILKPAEVDMPRPPSPPKEKNLTHEDIARKLQEAEERRLVSHSHNLSKVFYRLMQRPFITLNLCQTEEFCVPKISLFSFFPPK